MYQLTKTKTNPVLKFLGIVLVISISLELTRTFLSSPSIDEQMMITANELNKHCPIMVDSITRLDNTTALPGNRFRFNYRFISVKKSEVDTTVLQSEMKASIINTIKTDPKYKPFKENRVSLSATYYDSSGKYVCNLLVSESDYK